MTIDTLYVLKKTFRLFIQQALSKPWMRVRCVIAFLLIGVDVTSTSLVSYYSKQIVNTLPMQWGSAIWISASLFGIFWILETTVIHVQDIIFFPIINQTTRNMTYHTVEHIHKLPLLDYQKLSIPETINCIRRISQSARLFIKTIVLTLTPAFMKIFVAAWVLSKATLFAIVFVPLIGLALFLLYKITLWYIQARAQAWQISDKVILRINDSLLNTERCRFFKKQEMQNIAEYLDVEAACWQKTNKRLNSVHIVIGLLLGLTLSGTLMGIIVGIRSHHLSIGDFVFLQSQLIAALMPLRHFTREFRQMAEALVDIEKVIKILDMPIEKNTLKHYGNRSKQSGVHIDKISFQYDTSIIFDQASLHLKPGTKIGIVGENGCGKSTLLKLMSGLYQPQQGHIFIHDQSIHHYKKNDLHKMVHYIPQHYHLFNSSLKDNLCHGITTTASDNDLLEILKKVQLLAFVKQLPHGLDTPVGEMGTKLSGGEKQKIALARAFLLKPTILLLDETTNALSLEHEQIILDLLFESIPSIILSSHRPSAHQKLDQIFKIHDKQLLPQAALNISSTVWLAAESFQHA